MLKSFITTILACATLFVYADNTTVNVSQVSEPVTLSDDVDYAVSSSTPFTLEGSIDITNVENAILILHGVKPSEADAWLS